MAKELLKGNPGVVGEMAVTLAAVYPLLSLGIDFVKQKLIDYSDSDMEQIEAIKRIYSLYCVDERHASPSTLHVLSKEDEEKSIDYPVYFKMKEKVPVIYDLKVGISDNAEFWAKFLSKKDSGLLYYIEQMLKMICLYQKKRETRFFDAQKGYNYDPTNLFFDEFKWWLIELSKADFDENTEKIVKGRSRYLSQIISKGVFPAGKNPPSRMETIAYLRDALDNWVCPLIQVAKNREGGREHFNKLKSNVITYIQNSTQFIFYVFRNTPDTPNEFVLDYLRDTSVIYKNALETVSGKLLKALFSTKACMNACPSLTGDSLKDDITENLQSFCDNPFLDSNGQPIFPRKIGNLTVDDWFDEGNNCGILKYFRQTGLMKEFIKFHGLLQKVCVFYIICEQLYQLAGCGGDLGIYGKIVDKVINALKTYQLLMNEMQRIIQKFFDIARELQKIYLGSDENRKKEYIGDDKDEFVKNWFIHFGIVDSIYYKLSETKQNCEQIILEINQKIITLNSEKYFHRVNVLIKSFSQLADHFVEGKKITDGKELVPSTQNPQGFWSSKSSATLLSSTADESKVVNSTEQIVNMEEYQNLANDLKLAKKANAELIKITQTFAYRFSPLLNGAIFIAGVTLSLSLVYAIRRWGGIDLLRYNIPPPTTKPSM